MRLRSIYYWLLMLVMALMTGACEDSKSGNEDSDNPFVPVNPGDYQDVPVTGGTIEKGDIAKFPSGTFSKDEKVAITEVQKGEMAGKHEASTFYQITMPCTAGKPLTVKMKGTEQDGDVTFVAFANAYCMSSDTEKKVALTYQTTFSDGEYSATIPAVKGDVEGENISFVIGLGHVVSYSSNARTRGLLNEVLHEGKVGNVTYQVRFPYWTLLTYNTDILVQLEMKSKAIADYVQTSLTEIFDLGFRVDQEKTLYVDFAGGEDWGGHVVCGIPGEGGWSMWVSLGIEKLLNVNTTEADIKCTIIHEILHWVHAISYDPRNNYKKSHKQYGGEELIMYEMGAVWSEQFMNDGKLQGSFLVDYMANFLKCMNDVKVAQGSSKTPYAHHGYGMSAFLYYLTKTSKVSKDKVPDMYDIWSVDGMSDQSFKPFYQWLKQNHCKVLEDGKYYDFVYQLYSGKLIDEKTHINPKTLSNFNNSEVEVNSEEMFKGQRDCYPYGSSTIRFNVKPYRNANGENSFKGKEIVFKQTEPDVNTFIVLSNAGGSDFSAIDKIIEPGDSLVIDGSKAESLLKSGVPNVFHAVCVNSTGTEKVAKVSCQIRSSVAQKISKLSLGGTVKGYGIVERYDGKKGEGTHVYYPWASLTPEGNTTITGTLYGTALHVEANSKNNHQLADYETATYHISFDVENFVPDYKKSKLVNLKVQVTREGVIKSESSDNEYKMEWGLQASVIPLEKILYIPNSTSYITFKASVKDGLEMDSYYYNEERKYTTKGDWKISGENPVRENTTYRDDPDNYLELRFEFIP